MARPHGAQPRLVQVLRPPVIVPFTRGLEPAGIPDKVHTAELERSQPEPCEGDFHDDGEAASRVASPLASRGRAGGGRKQPYAHPRATIASASAVSEPDNGAGRWSQHSAMPTRRNFPRPGGQPERLPYTLFNNKVSW